MDSEELQEFERAVIAGETLTLLQVTGFITALTALVAGQLPAPTQRKETP